MTPPHSQAHPAPGPLWAPFGPAPTRGHSPPLRRKTLGEPEPLVPPRPRVLASLTAAATRRPRLPGAPVAPQPPIPIHFLLCSGCPSQQLRDLHTITDGPVSEASSELQEKGLVQATGRLHSPHSGPSLSGARAETTHQLQSPQELVQEALPARPPHPHLPPQPRPQSLSLGTGHA